MAPGPPGRVGGIIVDDATCPARQGRDQEQAEDGQQDQRDRARPSISPTASALPLISALHRYISSTARGWPCPMSIRSVVDVLLVGVPDA